MSISGRCTSSFTPEDEPCSGEPSHGSTAPHQAILSCTRSSEEKPNPRDRRDTATATDSAVNDVSQDTRDAAQDVREDVAADYTYARRDEFRQDVNERLQRLDQEIADLERTAKRDTDKARDSAVVHIRSARSSVARSLDRLAGATENTWDDIQAGVRRSVDSLELLVRAQRPDAKPMGGNGPS
ncbi:MAG TPA: hypothetical protein VFH40_04250 [Gemmatimonadales bacterium]|nr:hypothetical protein [Gemmatimonadales bacterium]